MNVKAERVESWEKDGELTYKQAQKLANVTHTAFGFLFLPSPPKVSLPLADFRTLDPDQETQPSPDLLETIYTMQRRMEWLSEERKEQQAEPLHFIGSAILGDDPAAIGQEMRRIVGIDHTWAKQLPTWTAAVGKLREAIEELGVMAVINGVVGNNAKRKLDVEEFRGFAISDPFAPLIFVNGADAKSAQMFTLAHELAHLWLGKLGEGVSGFSSLTPGNHKVETFCDQAAAEFLVPAQELRETWPSVSREEARFDLLARLFKVSPVVSARRCMDLLLIDRDTFFAFYREYVQQERNRKKKRASGGDFYNNQNTRIGRPFATQVLYAAKEGRLGFGEAYELTGLNGGAFQKYANKIGFSFP